MSEATSNPMDWDQLVATADSISPEELQQMHEEEEAIKGDAGEQEMAKRKQALLETAENGSEAGPLSPSDAADWATENPREFQALLSLAAWLQDDREPEKWELHLASDAIEYSTSEAEAFRSMLHNFARPCQSDRRQEIEQAWHCLLYTSPSPRDRTRSRMPSSA